MERNVSKRNEANNALLDMFFQMKMAMKCEHILGLNSATEKVAKWCENPDGLIEEMDERYAYLLMDLIDAVHAFSALAKIREEIVYEMTNEQERLICNHIRNVVLLSSILYTKQQSFYAIMNNHEVRKRAQWSGVNLTTINLN